jgi:serine protease
MERHGCKRALLAGIALLCAASSFVAGAQGGRSTGIADALPDLDQETPTQLTIEADRSGRAVVYRLGFRSAVRNIGDGPLILDGARPDTRTPYMTVQQIIERADDSPGIVPNVGRMAYVSSPDHSHWHYLQFERYELQGYALRRAGAQRPLLTDRKTGFCLGDRYRVTTRFIPRAAPTKVYRGRCGLYETELLHLRQGISVGYGDDYAAFLEGQDLPLSGLRNGRYVLVHRVNRDRSLHELSYANNAASVLVDLRWRKGVPSVRVLRTCPDTDRCDRPQRDAVDPVHGRRGVALAAAATADVSPAFIPNDAGLAAKPGGWSDLQWNFAGPYGVDAPAAWANLIRSGHPGGAGTIVAVLDTGVAYADNGSNARSPDFDAATFIPGYDFVENDAYPLDPHGHGTHVAATIAEQTNNGFGLTGLAYGVRIMPVRVLDADGYGYPDVIARGIRFAARRGAKVINLSLNFGPAVTREQIPEVMNALDYANRRGSLVVAAAGNGGATEVAYPARAPHVLAVGATTENGCLASFSNSGVGIDLVAPGGGTDAGLAGDAHCVAGRFGRPIYQTTSKAAFDLIGTSMATAHVSATAALTLASGVLGVKPGPLGLANQLFRTTRDLGERGYDARYGWGLVNAAAATARARATVRPGRRWPRVLPARYMKETSPG